MNTPSKDEMLAISDAAVGAISNLDCRLILAEMRGYMIHTTDLDAAKAFFFDRIKQATKDQTK